jgi:hypothetical protein
MTPRRIVGALYFAQRRRRFENAEALAVATLGSRGDPKAVKKQHMDWTKG